MHTLAKRFPALIALTLILTLAVSSGAALAEGAVVENVHPGNFDIYDYYADAYGLTADKAYQLDGEPYYYYTFEQDAVSAVTQRYYHPFAALQYEELAFLLQSERAEDYGYYAVVFGGEWEPNTAPTLENVNLAAAEIAASHSQLSEDGSVRLADSFINRIYNFDFKLNGGVEIEARLAEYGYPEAAEEYDTDIRKDQTGYGTGDNARTVTNFYKTLYDTLNVTDATPEAFTTERSVSVKGGAELNLDVALLNHINSPSVVLLLKENIGTDDAPNVKNTVVDFIDASTVDFTDDTQAEGFRARVSELLGKAESGLRTFDLFQYTWGSFTLDFTGALDGQKYSAQFNNLSDSDHVFKSIPFPVLVRILQQEGNYAVYLGGAWCPYSKGFLAPINQIAKSYGVNAIYVFDPRLDGKGSSTEIRRDEGIAGLFVRLSAYLQTYFGVDYNAYTFANDEFYLSKKLGVKSEDLLIAGRLVTHFGVPTLLVYNKDNVDANGNPLAIAAQTSSSGSTYAGIIQSAAEPVKYGTAVTPDDAQADTLYYEGVSFIDAAKTSIYGEKARLSIFSFFEDFFGGKTIRTLK